MIGTDREIHGSKKKSHNGRGRPPIDRELILRNMKLVDSNGVRRYTDKQLASMAGCKPRSIRRLRVEFREAGLLEEVDQDKKGIGIIEAELDAECTRAMGYSFHDWLHTRFKNDSQAHTVFNFCSQVWEQTWDKCSLVEMSERGNNLADQCAMKFNEKYGDDRPRMRSRIKKISFLFRFLDIEGVRKKHMRLDNSKHPRSKRKVPEITNVNFGLQYQEIEDQVANEFETKYGLGFEARLMLRFKICSQMRTGDIKDERELFGLIHGSQGKNYIKFLNDSQFVAHIFAKRSEEWDLIWLPAAVKDDMKKHLSTINEGDLIWKIDVTEMRNVFGKWTKKITGRRFILHDTRKISVTWLYCLGVPSEVACLLNVGWLDISTAFSHYLDAKKLLRGSFKEEYSSHIPEWFKEGLDDFIGQDAALPSSGGGHW